MKKTILISLIILFLTACEKVKTDPKTFKKGTPTDVPSFPGGDPDQPN